MLMESLSESGFDNVVAIRLPEATEALARGIAEVLGYPTTAVCVVEPESVISLIVNTSDGAVQTAFNHAIDSDDALISWLSTIFARADWAPEALVVVGSAGHLEPILDRLEDALSVPVFAPEEAKLALARGAALASAQSTQMPFGVFDDDGLVVDARTDAGRHHAFGPRRRTLSSVGPVAMLAVGVLTFVVSVSIAVSLQLSPARTAQPSPAPAAKVETSDAVRAVPPALPPPAAVPAAPVVEAAPPPPPEALPPVYEEPPVAVVDTPAEAPYVDQAPAVDPAPVDPGLAPPVDPALAPPMAGTPLPPTVAPAYVPPVPTKKPGILTRIKEKLTPGPG